MSSYEFFILRTKWLTTKPSTQEHYETLVIVNEWSSFVEIGNLFNNKSLLKNI